MTIFSRGYDYNKAVSQTSFLKLYGIPLVRASKFSAVIAMESSLFGHVPRNADRSNESEFVHPSGREIEVKSI